MPTVLKKSLLVLILSGSTVGGSFAQLSANFTYQIACDRTVTFTNSSSGFTTTNWDFGDANTSSAANPSHQYATSGSFTVILTVSNGVLASSASQSVTVHDTPGQAITGSLSVCANGQETYSVASSGNNYVWNVSGGGILSGQGTPTVNIQWLTSGTGTVQVTETNAIGCSTTTTANVTIHPLPTPFIPGSADSSGGTTQDRIEACFDDFKTYSIIAPTAGSTYLWEITGGTIIGSNTADSVVVHWDTEGEGLIKITETNSFGCTGSGDYRITVKPSPIANFTTEDVCLGSEAVFTDQSTGNPVMWHWDFGDGSNSQIQFPTHIYAAPGAYDVTLIVSASPLYFNPPFYSTEACTDDTTISISVDQNPGLPLICPGTACAGDEQTYTTTAVAGATYDWTVTGGTITSGGGPADNEITVLWGSVSPGIISLQQTGGTGSYCALPSITEIPIVSSSPQINGPGVACQYSTIVYEAPLLPGAVYSWTVTGATLNYGQGTNSISVYFNTAGTKTIAVDVFHDLANCGGQATKTVQVANPFYFYANSACANTSQNYSVSGTPSPTGFTTWNWTVTGGTITSGQGTGTVTIQWGSGTVGEITVDAPAGVYCNSREKRTVTIVPPPPPAPLTGALNVCASSSVTYLVPEGYYNTWTVTGGTVTSGGTGKSYATIQWGTGATGQITLKQEDNTVYPTCPTTTTFAVTLTGNNPVAIGGPVTVCSNSTATYTASTPLGAQNRWEVTGGTILSGTGTNSITVRWGTGLFGTVSVTEQICNNADILTVEIITPEAPVIATADLTCSGSSVTLFLPGDYASQAWSNGSVDTFASITSAGTYSVTATDIFGCSAMASVTVGAIPRLPVPVASIAGAGAPVNPFSALRLTAYPADHGYLWSNGSNNQSTFVTAAGTYRVTVTNEYGCTDDESVVVTSQGGGLDGGGGSCPGGGSGSPCAGLTPSFTNTNCNPVQFTNTTNPPAAAYFWNFGNGSYSWDENPVHVFAATGNYNVTLWATDGSGCWSYTTMTVTLNSFLTAGFNFSGCPGQPVQFTDVSSSALPITGWQWDFDDASPVSTLQNPAHLFSPGNYLVEFTITDGICSDTFLDTVVTHQLDATFSYQEACLGMSTLFMDNTSYAPSRSVVRWRWDFGDGTTANRKNPAHRYNAAGSYNVTLTVTDMKGCSASTTTTVNVLQFTAGNMSYTGTTTFCHGDSLMLTAPSGAGYAYRWSTGVTTQSISAKQTGAYYVVVTEPAGCKDTVGPVSILVYPPPFAYITANGPVKFCDQANYTTLAANPGGTGFTYQWFHDGAPIGTSQSQWVYEMANSGDYTVVVADNHGCRDTSSALTVEIYPNPPYFSVSASGPLQFCQGGSVTLSAPAGYSYEWTNGSSSISTTVFTSGRHQVTITDANGCKRSSGGNVDVKPLPDMRLVPYGCYDICLSDSSRAHAPPNMSSYAWSTGATTPSIVIRAAGTYSVTAVNSFGCSNSSGNLYISTTNFLGIDIGNDTTFCEGGSVTFDAGAGFTSYSWHDASTGATFTADATGIYFVNVTDSNGCQGGDTAAVVVFPNPVVNLDDTLICTASNYVLDAGAGYGSYLWNDFTTNQTFMVSATGNYRVTVEDSYGCSGTDDADITFSPAGSGVDIGNDTTFCEGGSVTFDAGAGFTSYSWHDASTGATFTADATGTYFVNVTDSNGCQGGDTAAVVVFPNPVINLTDTLICAASNYVLDAGAGFDSYLWNDFTTNQTLIVSATGNYSVTVEDSYGCSGTDDASVTLSPTGAGVDLGNDVSFCDGGTVTFDAGAGFDNYLWQDGTTTTQTFTAAVSGTYIVIVSDTFGCSARDTAELTVHPNPVVDLRDTAVCEIINIVLDAGAGFTYRWNDNSAGQTLAVTAPGAYSVTITDGNGCTAYDNAGISLSSSSAPLMASASVASICAGESVQLSATGGTSYNWSPPATLDNASVSNPVAAPLSTTTYIVSSNDTFGCMKGDTITISVLPVFTAAMDSAKQICHGENVQLNVAGGAAYAWSPAAGLSCTDCANPVASPEQTTDYSVTVSASGFCNNAVVLNVNVAVHPLPDPGLLPATTIAYGSEVTFTPNGGMAEYDWTATDGWVCAGCPAPTVSPANTTTYTLTVTDVNGCKAVALGTVEVLSECEGKFFIPTAFSPNGDGHNDLFRIIHPGDLNLIDFKVFNRWGETVFETKDPNEGWDGMYKGDKQDLVVFAYYVQMTCGNVPRTIVGNVTLVH